MFGIAALELWASVPTGFALKLHPLLNAIATILGASTGVIIVILLGDRARTWILRKRKWQNEPGKNKLIVRIWQRCGIIGLGLLGPLLVGAPLGAAIGIALGAPATRLIFWMAVGIILWTAILTIACALGIETFTVLWHKYI